MYLNGYKPIRSGTKITIAILLLSVLQIANAKVDAELTTKIEKRILETKIQGHFPGVAVAVLENGVPIFISTMGSANLEHDIDVTEKTVFELASLTKQMTALAIARLVEQGKLSYGTKLSSLVSDIPEEWQHVTVNQLLSHTAGFEHHFEPMMNASHLLENSTLDMFSAAKSMPMRSNPGEDWHYSDLGYFLLGKVIESVTAKTYAKHMHETFFKPLGMTQTHLLDQNKIVPHRAQGYRWNNEKLERNRRVWNFELTPHFGVMSSLKDLIIWEQALVGVKGDFLNAVKQTIKIQRSFSTGSSCDTWGYARGWFASIVNGIKYVNHGGYAGTAYLRNVERGLSVIVLTNREDGQNQINPIEIAWRVMNVLDASTPKKGFECWR